MTDSPAPVTSPPRGIGLGLFLLSAAILTLQVLQTRLFSYSLSPLLLYTAIGLTLLGMGASASLMTLWQGWRRLRLGTLGGIAAGGFALTTVGAHVLFARESVGLIDFTSPHLMRIDGATVLLCAVLTLPYAFAGVGVTACLSGLSGRVHSTYFLNLLGSAAGCFGVAFLMRPLTGPVLLGAVCLLGALAGLAFLRAGGHALAKVVVVLGLLVSAAATLVPAQFYRFQPDASGQLAGLRMVAAKTDRKLESRFESWDPTGHIELHELPGVPSLLPEPVPSYFYAQDGSAGSVVFGVGDKPELAAGLYERTLYGAAHQLRGEPGAKVLIIGLGGAPDVMCAHHYGAVSVTGVDINQSAIDVLRGPLAAYSGNPYNRPNVTTAHMDGRTFVRSSREQYDLLVMSGADTKSVHAAGALAISENQLYTVEAFQEYLARLTDRGVLAVLRFSPYDRMKLSAIGVAALRANGVREPERHFMILGQDIWTSVLVGKAPFQPEDIARVQAWIDTIPSPTGIFIPYFDGIGFGLGSRPVLMYPAPTGAPANDITPFFAAVTRGEEAAYLDGLPDNLQPTTDDRPFFFDTQRPDRLLSEPRQQYQLLGRFLLVLAALAAVFIALPLPMVLGARRQQGLVPTLLYFASLGMGFIVLEIALIQKLCLFLGHQTYAVTVVLATLLVGAGLGSATAGAVRAGSGLIRGFAIPAILLLSWGVALGLDWYGVSLAQLDLAQRIGVATAAILPLGFALGMPFPTALSTTPQRLGPWAIAANGFTSVIGASMALPIAMVFGYRWLLVVGGVCYVLAALLYPRRRDATA